MADAGQSFGWWSTGGPQGSSSTDGESSLYPDRHAFNQTDNTYQCPYDSNPEHHHSQAEGGNIWLPMSANPIMPASAMEPLTNSVSSQARSPFHTAPPHPLPPSQVHGLREYHTDPQPRDVQSREIATVYGMQFDPVGAIDLNNFMVRLLHRLQENQCSPHVRSRRVQMAIHIWMSIKGTYLIHIPIFQ
jgi:hypothetical protein